MISRSYKSLSRLSACLEMNAMQSVCRTKALMLSVLSSLMITFRLLSNRMCPSLSSFLRRMSNVPDPRA